jgi:hypothetical protein
VIRATSGVAHGAAQHNNSLESWFMHAPGLNLAVPGTPRDVKGLIKTALRTDEPVIFLMHKRLTGERGEIPDGEDLVPFGQARIVRPGDGCTLVSYGATVATVVEAADRLQREGVGAEVIDLRTLFPLDLDAVVASVRKTGRRSRLRGTERRDRGGGAGGRVRLPGCPGAPRRLATDTGAREHPVARRAAAFGGLGRGRRAGDVRTVRRRRRGCPVRWSSGSTARRRSSPGRPG